VTGDLIPSPHEGVPAPRDRRRAARGYLLGHDRGGSPEVKWERAQRIERPPVERPEAAIPVEVGAPREVVVPGRLDFHRSAGTWRDGIPGSGPPEQQAE